MRDELGQLFADEQFSNLFPRPGCPGPPSATLDLALVLQFVGGLSDRQSADPVRGRTDWKYALNLELSDPGFDCSVLSEFRDRVVAGGRRSTLMEVLLNRCREHGLPRAGGRQRTDSTHVLAATREINRMELAVETLRCALNAPAAAGQDWLAEWIPAE
ncbi:transposase [Streptomyces sp. NPDC058239]|uniref:transposase n=1 Tax=unclassified Streptomyces TaxID=2593676 RepID=UPI00365CCB93